MTRSPTVSSPCPMPRAVSSMAAVSAQLKMKLCPKFSADRDVCVCSAAASYSAAPQAWEVMVGPPNLCCCKGCEYVSATNLYQLAIDPFLQKTGTPAKAPPSTRNRRKHER